MPLPKTQTTRMASSTPASGGALLSAVVAGDEATVAELLATGADPNSRQTALCPTWNKAPTDLGCTALMLAMRGGHDGISMKLLSAKADPLLVDQFNKSAAMIALEYGHIHMQSLRTMLEQPPAAKLLQADDWGHSLIMYAALSGASHIVELLLKSDNWQDVLAARVRDGEHEDLDVLTLTAKHGHGKVIQVLLREQYRPLLLDASLQNTKAGARPPGDRAATLDTLSKSRR